MELNSSDDRRLAQILLHDDLVTIHWYSGTTEAQMQEILQVIARETGWAVYDPQDGSISRPC